MNIREITNGIPIMGEVKQMTDGQMQNEFDYYMAQKLLMQLLIKEHITQVEFDKITKLNRQIFSPLLAEIMPWNR